MSNINNAMKLQIESKSANESFARSVVGAFFAQLNPTIDEIEDLKTAVSEAVTNSIVHGYNKSQDKLIDISCQLFDNYIVTTITDYGEGIEDIDSAMKPFYTTCTTGEHSGMGFAVMQAFCDNVEVTSDNGTTVKLTKKVGQ